MIGRIGLERTPDGHRLIASHKIDAPAGDVWRVFVEPARWPTWGPSITAVDCEHERIRAGTTGRVRTVGGLWLPFKIATCQDDRWTWQIGPVTATGHRVTPLGPDRCRVAFEVPILAGPYVLVTVIALRRIERLVT
ncbi:MAG: SRPBCC family protein [Haloarculaceae archaeon]